MLTYADVCGDAGKRLVEHYAKLPLTTSADYQGGSGGGFPGRLFRFYNRFLFVASVFVRATLEALRPHTPELKASYTTSLRPHTSVFVRATLEALRPHTPELKASYTTSLRPHTSVFVRATLR
jgi:hypothetical protein